MRAVMYGAGNIGRGFVGALMSGAGYEVTFIDVDQTLVSRLREKGEYPLRVIDNEGYTDTLIKNVSAVDGTDAAAVADAIANCSLMATAVGARIMPKIAPLIAKGLKQRFAKSRDPLNIIICENLMDADKVLEKLIKQELTPEEIAAFDGRVGLVEASIGRMVPVQTEEMRAGDPLRVTVEAYGFLPVDQNAFKGAIPGIPGLVPFAPFDFYLKRKLFLHNMGHACCAYLGLYTGETYIYEAIAREEIELITQNAMQESIGALSKRYGVPAPDLQDHANDLIFRFGNRQLMDTCARVGGDIRRKLSKNDRLIGAALLCREQGICPVYIALGAGCALRQLALEEEAEAGDEEALTLLLGVSGLPREDPLCGLIMAFYRLFREGAPLSDIHRFAKAKKHDLKGPVV